MEVKRVRNWVAAGVFVVASLLAACQVKEDSESPALKQLRLSWEAASESNKAAFCGQYYQGQLDVLMGEFHISDLSFQDVKTFFRAQCE